MKVILLQDVAKVGRKYDVKEVSEGYAANFLFPRKLAAPATKENENTILKKKSEIEAERKAQEALLTKNISALDDAKVTIKAKADEKGHLYAKIHAKEIVEAIKSQLSLEIPEEYIKLKEPIKEVGKTELNLHFADKKSRFSVFVESI